MKLNFLIKKKEKKFGCQYIDFHVSLSDMKPVYIGLIATCAALTLATVGIYLSQLVFIYKYLGNWTLRFHAGFLLSIYPVSKQSLQEIKL